MSNRLNYVSAGWSEIAMINEKELWSAEDPENRTVLVLGGDQDFLVVTGTQEELSEFALRVTLAVASEA